jgi:hypothetical protein
MENTFWTALATSLAAEAVLRGAGAEDVQARTKKGAIEEAERS